MKRHPLIAPAQALVLLLASLSLRSVAAEPQSNGVLASVFVILGLGGFTLLNLLLQLLFYFNGQYRQRDIVWRHTLLSLLMPLLAVVMVLLDHSSAAYMTLNLGLILVACALALLPLQLQASAREASAHAGKILLLAALLLLLISIFLWPVALMAIAPALWAKRWLPTAHYRYGRWLLVLLSLAWPVMAAWQMAEHYLSL